MPTYEYECEFCYFKFDISKKISELDIDEVCPQCGTICRRIISGGSTFILKGDGWGNGGYSKNKNKQ